MSLLTQQSTRPKRTTLQRCTQVDREARVDLAMEKGIKSASRELGMPYSTLHA